MNYEHTKHQYQQPMQGCAHSPGILQNVSEHQILWSLCSVVFHALTLRLPIQTSLSVALKLPVSLSSAENEHTYEYAYGDTPLPLENGGDQFPSGTLYKSINLTKLELGIQSDAHADIDTQCVFTLKAIILVTKKIKRHKSSRLSYYYFTTSRIE